MKVINRVSLAAVGLLLSACATPDTAQPVKTTAPPMTRMSSSDIKLADTTFQRTLERSTSGRTATWRNPTNGHRGSITPRRTYRTQGGLVCRVYEESLTLEQTTHSFRNTACRDADGVWKPI